MYLKSHNFILLSRKDSLGFLPIPAELDQNSIGKILTKPKIVDFSAFYSLSSLGKRLSNVTNFGEQKTDTKKQIYYHLFKSFILHSKETKKSSKDFLRMINFVAKDVHRSKHSRSNLKNNKLLIKDYLLRWSSNKMKDSNYFHLSLIVFSKK